MGLVPPRPAQITARVRTSRTGVLTGRALRLWALNPRWSMAVKASVAAALAWYVGVLAPAPFSDYPYYAPLGAVIATSTTVARSVRETAQTTGAILLGVVIARLADAFLDPGALSIAVVVCLATLGAGWSRLGEMGAYVTTTALFVLVIGSGDPGDFVGAYAGLVVAGALVGIGVNFAFPPLPLSPSDVALDGLRDTLADQLESLADGLRGDRPPTAEEWDDRRFAIRPVLEKSRAAVAYAGEASKGNWHARRYSAWSVAQARRSVMLEKHANLVDHLTNLLTETETQTARDPALGPDLRPPAADALAEYAAALRALEVSTDDSIPDPPTALQHAVDALRDAVREQRSRREGDFLAAGALVLGLDRALRSVGADADERRAEEEAGVDDVEGDGESENGEEGGATERLRP